MYKDNLSKTECKIYSREIMKIVNLWKHHRKSNERKLLFT